MTGFRLLQSQEEYEQAIDLADKVFRTEGQTSMGTAFPQVFSTALGQSYGAFVDGKLISFIGLVPSILHIEGAEVTAYSIGAVCTDPNFRKKGFANKLLQMTFDHITKSGGTLLIVSGDLPIYLKQGCAHYGKMKKYVLHPDDLIKMNHSYQIRELGPYDWFQLRRLSKNRPVRFEQSIFEIAQLNEAAGYASIFKMNHKVLVAEEKQEIKAFLIFGLPTYPTKRVDSRVIEWAGESKAVYTLLTASFNYNLDTLIFNVPNYENEINSLLKFLPHADVRFPNTIKIMNLDLLITQLQPYFNDRMVKIVKIDSNRYQLALNDQTYILKPKALEEYILNGSDIANDVFPVPIPYPEGLNYT